MPFFKYYRPNHYLEKAIRYNEIYFSGNNELNDPHDLDVSFEFEDSVENWQALFELKPAFANWDLCAHLVPNRGPLAAELNSLFKGSGFQVATGSLHDVLLKTEQNVLEILARHLQEGISLPHGQNGDTSTRAKLCHVFLKELLTRSVRRVCYSVSFSESALDPMMWAHYAEGFRGCVVIYRGSQTDPLQLRYHPADAQARSFSFHKVEYVDDAGPVPVLRCALNPESESRSAFLRKSAFWRYEAEQRVLLESVSDPVRESLAGIRHPSSRDRIFHHHPGDIIGVIFGPRCDQRTRQKVDVTLFDNRRRLGLEPALLFETELTRDGRVVIHGGKARHSATGPADPNDPGIYQVLKGDPLAGILGELGISHPGAPVADKHRSTD